MPTKAQITRTNAASFAQLLEELLAANPSIMDFYYCDHTGVWCINQKHKEFEEFETFQAAFLHLVPTKPEEVEESQHPFHKWIDDFTGWAEAFFSPENGHTDRIIPKSYVVEDLRTYTKTPFTMHRFTKALLAWTDKRGFILNPSELVNLQSRIVRRIEGKAYDCLYIQTKGMPINHSAEPMATILTASEK